MNSITQDMKYRQSLLTYAQKYGVSRASRKYNKSRSYIYFWKARWDGTAASLACRSRRPHSHPSQHTGEELKLIRDMRRRWYPHFFSGTLKKAASEGRSGPERHPGRLWKEGGRLLSAF